MRADLAVDDGDPQSRSASPWQVAKAVASAFFGVRRKSDHDAVKFSPVHVVIAGLVGAALFVLTLVTLVRFITS